MSTRKSRGRIGRIFWLLAAVAMIVAVMPLAGAAAETADAPRVVNLIVDGGADSTTWVDIGEVQVWDDGTDLFVKYVVDVAPWCLTATHVDVVDIAMTKKGLPKVGKFAFKAEHDCVTEFELDPISLEGLPTEFKIAAHADTLKVGGLEGVEMILPDTAQMLVRHPGTQDGYFEAFIRNGGVLDTGTDGYTSWCVDIGHTISPGRWYDVDVFSSYEDYPDPPGDTFGNIDKPGNLDAVNWLINNMNVGTEVFVDDDGDPFTPDVSLGIVNKYDVQRAIWTLLDNSMLNWGSYSPPRVAAMVAAALLDGEGFEPGCNERFAVILADSRDVSQSTVFQTTFIELGIECEDREETAWAGDWTENPDGTGDFGYQFDPLSSWSGYFMYTVTMPEVVVEA